MKKITIEEKRRLRRNKLSREWKAKHMKKVKAWNSRWYLAKKKLANKKRTRKGPSSLV